MFKHLKSRLDSLWRQLEQAGDVSRSVLAVLSTSSCQHDLRVFAIEQGWRMSFATTLRDALDIRQTKKIEVIIYDQDLPDAPWRQGLFQLLDCTGPALAILLSCTADARICRTVLESGGFAVARKPVDRGSLVPLVNGALQLAEDIDSCRISELHQHQ